jgi:hypothetical protein
MSDARLVIALDDGGAGGSKLPGGASTDGDLLTRWRALTEAMGRSIDDATARARRARSYSPAGASPWTSMDFDAQRRAALGGRPEGITNAEWAAFGKENARRGAAGAKVSGRAQEEAARRREQADALAEEALARIRKERADREREAQAAHAAREAQNARFAQIAIQGAMGSGSGKYQQMGGALGSVAGTIIGGRFGPVGAAIGSAVGQKAGDKLGARLDDPLLPLTNAAKFAGDAIRELGSGAVKVAGGDGMGVFQVGVQAAAKGLEQIPIAGKFAATTLRVAGDAFMVVKDVADAFAARGKELRGYNGQIAGAAAMQDVTRTLTDIREAQLLGDKYAQLIDAQTRFEETLKAGLLPLKEAFLEHIVPVMDSILEGIIAILRWMDKFVPFDLLKNIADKMDEMSRALKGGGIGGAGADLVAGWLAAPGLAFGFGPPGEPPAAPAPLGIPLIPPGP